MGKNKPEPTKQVKAKAKPEAKKIDPMLSEYFSRLGKIGGSLGGTNRARNLSKRRLRQIAKLGAAARKASLDRRKQQQTTTAA